MVSWCRGFSRVAKLRLRHQRRFSGWFFKFNVTFYFIVSLTYFIVSLTSYILSARLFYACTYTRRRLCGRYLAILGRPIRVTVPAVTVAPTALVGSLIRSSNLPHSLQRGVPILKYLAFRADRLLLVNKVCKASYLFCDGIVPRRYERTSSRNGT